MKILADESLDGPVVAWLRELGHDVVWAVEHCPGASDRSLVDQARAMGQVVITADRDFGDLVFRQGLQVPGIALLRIRTRSAEGYLRVFQEHWAAVESKVTGHFVVMSRGRIRVRPLGSSL